MASYTGTFKCGHEGKVVLYGSRKDREWKLKNAFDCLCDECYWKQREKEHNEENERAKTKAEEYGFPQLAGTEKQIAWANTIRVATWERLSELCEKGKYIEPGSFNRWDEDELRHALCRLARVVRHYKDASFWIENRDELSFGLSWIMKMGLAIKKEEEERFELTKEQELRMESLIYSEKEDSDAGFVELTMTDLYITATYGKDERFIKIMHDYDFSYSQLGSCWTLDITEFTGMPIDRCVEIAVVLLDKGYNVSVLNETVRQKIIEREFVPRQRQWIKYNERDEEFVIVYGEFDERTHRAAKRLGSYKSGKVYVDFIEYKRLQRFAKRYGFEFSKKALECLEACKAKDEEPSKTPRQKHKKN